MVVGITGGIGSGKSTIAQVFKSLGYPVYNSDFQAKYLMANDPDLVRSLKTRFGEQIISNNTLNRPLLAKQLFGNPENQHWIKENVHSKVRQDFNHWVDHQQAQLIFLESALLIETKRYLELDTTILVLASEETRMKRVMKRDNLSPEEVKLRMNDQLTDAFKRDVCEFIVDNNDTVKVLPQLFSITQQLLQKEKFR